MDPREKILEVDFAESGDVADIVLGMLALPDCPIVLVTGGAGVGKTTVLDWCAHLLERRSEPLPLRRFACSHRSYDSLCQALEAGSSEEILFVDGLDELDGPSPEAPDQFFASFLGRPRSRARLVASVRTEMLSGMDAYLERREEMEEGHVVFRTRTGAAFTVLRLDLLSLDKIVDYLRRRGLSRGNVEQLLGLYDLQELARRFYLLDLMCSRLENGEGELDFATRGDVYEQTLERWVRSERNRAPQVNGARDADFQLALEQLATDAERWTNQSDLGAAVGAALKSTDHQRWRHVDPDAVAHKLVEGSLVGPGGFSHRSVEEFLLARALVRWLRTREPGSPLPPWASRTASDEIVDFAANIMSADGLRVDGLPPPEPELCRLYLRLHHRLGGVYVRAPLRNAHLVELSMPGIRLPDADLRGADLRGAVLGAVDLARANLAGAQLDGAQLGLALEPESLWPCAWRPTAVWFVSERGVALVDASNGQHLATYDLPNERLQTDGRNVFEVDPEEGVRFLLRAAVGAIAPELAAAGRATVAQSAVEPAATWWFGDDTILLARGRTELFRCDPPNPEPPTMVAAVPRSIHWQKRRVDVVFISHGDIYTAHPDTGVQRVTTGGGLEAVVTSPRCLVVRDARGWRTLESESPLRTVNVPAHARISAFAQVGFAALADDAVWVLDPSAEERYRTSLKRSLTFSSFAGYIASDGRPRVLLREATKLPLYTASSHGAQECPWSVPNLRNARYDQSTSFGAKTLERQIRKAGAQRSSARIPPPTATSCKRVFVSYAREDSEFVELLQLHAGSLSSESVIDLWTDRDLRDGEWEPQILQQLDKADIVIVIVTKNILGATSYVRRHELPRALARMDAGTCKVWPIICGHCDWKNLTLPDGRRLGRINALPHDYETLGPKSDEFWYQTIVEVRDLLEPSNAVGG